MRSKLKKEIKPFISSTIAVAILALSINILLLKYRIISGGPQGYGIIVNYTTNISIGLFLFMANTIILLFLFLIVGKSSGIKGIYGYIIFSILIEVFKRILSFESVSIDSFTKNALLLSIQGVITSFSMAIILRNKYSIGGYSSIFPIISKFTNITAPLFFLIMDAILALITTIEYDYSRGILIIINAISFFISLNIWQKVINKHLK